MAPTHRLGTALRSQLATHLTRHPRHRFELGERRAAAVALTVVADESGQPSLLLTRRSSGLRRHAGQWAIPGGRLDDGETLEQAALRELEEEMGIRVSETDVLGQLDDFATRSGFVITPVVIWAGDSREIKPDPNEVSAVYWVRFDELDHPDMPVETQIPESDRPGLSLPFRHTRIHAPTAAILYQFSEVAVQGRTTRVHHYEQPLFAWK